MFAQWIGDAPKLARAWIARLRGDDSVPYTRITSYAQPLAERLRDQLTTSLGGGALTRTVSIGRLDSRTAHTVGTSCAIDRRSSSQHAGGDSVAIFTAARLVGNCATIQPHLRRGIESDALLPGLPDLETLRTATEALVPVAPHP